MLDLTTLPSCAVPCLAAQCSSNTTCICEIGSAADSCILSACYLSEALSTRVRLGKDCQTPARDRTMEFNLLVFIAGSITVTIVIARLVYKQFFTHKKRLEMQDWAILIAAIPAIACIGLTSGGLTAHGLGRDIWAVPEADLLYFGSYFYAAQILYVTIIAILKLSLCFFYLNVFPCRITHRILWATVVFHVLGGIAFVVGIVFECLPISNQWTRYDLSATTPQEAKCMNINALGWANAILNVASDLWLLLVPIYHLKQLDLHWKKKVGVTVMFGTGACITVISFLRLKSLIQFGTTTNPTWDQWDLVWWSAVEIIVGFLCTSLPTMRLILVRLAPRIFSTARNTPRREVWSSAHDIEISSICPPSPAKLSSTIYYKDNLIIDPERFEIRTQPLGDEPGFKKIRN